MPFPSRFAGFESPEALLSDLSLTRTEKITALHAWRGMLVRLHQAGAPDARGRAPLVAAIDRALREVRDD